MQKSIAAVAKKVVNYIRLPLLAPEELKTIEDENSKDKMIPVGYCLVVFFLKIIVWKNNRH